MIIISNSHDISIDFFKFIKILQFDKLSIIFRHFDKLTELSDNIDNLSN